MGLGKNIEWKVSGGQINVASGNATINATQNNNIANNELREIIEGILNNLEKIDEESAETIKDAVQFAEQGFASQQPKSNKLKNCITLLAPMLTVLNGVPVLAGNIQKLIDYIKPYIN